MPKSVSIYLGSKCNANCLYCHREIEQEQEDCSTIINKLKEWTPKKIKFFGGEPLLYIDQIKKIVEALPGSSYQVTTNGLLLPKYMDFLKEHNFRIVLSYDGTQERSLRKVEIPQMDLSGFSEVSVSTTLYHNNADLDILEKAFCALEERINRRLTIYPHIMHVTSESNTEYGLTKDDLDNIIAGVKDRVSRLIEVYEKYGVLLRKNIGYLYILCKRQNLMPGETGCVSKDYIKTDINGNLWDCLYIRNKQATEPYSLPDEFKSCYKCEHYSLCGAACVKSKQHNLECYYYKSLFSWWKKFYPQHKKAIDVIRRRALD